MARTSADEFAVAQPAVDGSDGAALPDSLLEAVAMPYRVAGVEVVTTASIGVAVAQDAQRSAEELLRRAGAAVHRAKARGRHRWELHDPTDGDGAVERLHLLGQLRRSIDQGGLVLHYQPRLDVQSRRAVGVEALVRWEHPTRGMVPPGEFIGLAEQSGLIRPLGVWVLRTAVEQAAAWARSLPTPLEISVNLSARQLSDPNLIPTVRDALDQYGLDPALLILEITETALMEDAEAAVATLGQLKEIGVGLAVDDFGTGYASLTYLRTLPLDELKIDRTFVDGVAHSPHDRAIVAGCIHLAHGVGLRAVAEGVETEEHHAALVALGCDQAQGYLYRRPVPAEELTRWVTGRAEIPTQATAPAARRRRA
nr:GGDEF domain-containing phosphodiesterase [Actinotalea soli]